MDIERSLKEPARSRDLAPLRELVEPLVEHDRERRCDLVRTLRVDKVEIRRFLSLCTLHKE